MMLKLIFINYYNKKNNKFKIILKEIKLLIFYKYKK